MKYILLAIGAVLLSNVPAKASPFTGHFTTENWQQNKVITGKVTDEKGEPLANVTIQVKGTNNLTVSAADGSLSIETPPEAKTLVFSYVGMETQEVSITEGVSYSIKLKALADTMEDVVVIG